MVQELIFILVIIVIILAVIAQRAQRVTYSADSKHSFITSKNVESPATPSTAQNTARSKTRTKTSRVRFSPDKKERVYSIKTGEIVGENTVQIEDVEVEN